MTAPSKVRDTRAPGHFWADNELIDHYLPQIGVYGFAVYMLLARFAHNRTGACDPSVETLARTLGISVPTVRKALGVLAEQGLIVIARRTQRRGATLVNLTNRYTLLAISKQHRVEANDQEAVIVETEEELQPRPKDEMAAASEHNVAAQVGNTIAQGEPVPEEVGNVVTQDAQLCEPTYAKEADQVGNLVSTNNTSPTRLKNPPPPPPAEAVAAALSPVLPSGQLSPLSENALPSASPAPEADTEALLAAMGVRSRKVRQALASAAPAQVHAWKCVLDEPQLHQALLARGITDPVAFAVGALRDGNGPPDEVTLRRWLRPPGSGATSQQPSPIRNVSTIPPEEWSALSAAERDALMAAQAQRVNWRAAYR